MIIYVMGGVVVIQVDCLVILDTLYMRGMQLDGHEKIAKTRWPKQQDFIFPQHGVW